MNPEKIPKYVKGMYQAASHLRTDASHLQTAGDRVCADAENLMAKALEDCAAGLARRRRSGGSAGAKFSYPSSCP